MPEVKRKTATFSEFSFPAAAREKSGSLGWTECVNFTFRNGALTGEIGAKRVCDDNPMNHYDVKALYFYDSPNKSEILFLTSTGLCKIEFPMSANSSVTLLLRKTFSSSPCAIPYQSKSDGKYLLLLFGEDGLYVYDGNEVTEYTNVPKAKTACRYNDRLFLVSADTPGRVYFSLPADETDWSATYGGAGYIDFDPGEGEIRGIFPGEKGVWLLRDGRVTFLNANGENNGFSVAHIVVQCGKIYDGSAQAFGNGMVFLCDDGLRFFEDGAVMEIEPETTAQLPVDAAGVCSGVWNGLYFAAYTDAEGKYCVLFASPREKKVFFGNFGVRYAARRKNECYFMQNGTLACFTAESGSAAGALQKTYKSAPTDFGLGATRKILRAVTLEGEGDFTLTVLSDGGGKRVFLTSLKNASFQACPALKGRLFTFLIESASAACRLKKLIATVDLPQGGGK